jgi:CobQ/CobB/MinD/ParA nucleotide binding domain protein
MKVLLIGGRSGEAVVSAMRQKFSDGSVEFASIEYIEDLQVYLNTGGFADRLLVMEQGLNRDGERELGDLYQLIQELTGILCSRLSNADIIFVSQDEEVSDFILSLTFMLGDRVGVLYYNTTEKFKVSFFRELSLVQLNSLKSNLVLGKFVYEGKGSEYHAVEQVNVSNNFTDVEKVDDFDSENEFNEDFTAEDTDTDWGDTDTDTDWGDTSDLNSLFGETEEKEETAEKEETDSVTDIVSIDSDLVNDNELLGELPELPTEDFGLESSNIDVDFTTVEEQSENEVKFEEPDEFDSFTGDSFDNELVADSSDDFAEDVENADNSLTLEESNNEKENLEDVENESTEVPEEAEIDSLSSDLFAEQDRFTEESDSYTEEEDTFKQESDVSDLFETDNSHVEIVSDGEQEKIEEAVKVEVKSEKPVKEKHKFGLFGRGKERKKEASKENLEVELREMLDSYNRRGHVMTVSGSSDSGKTTIAGNTANLIANMGYTVALVDFDLHKRGQVFLNSSAYESVIHDDNYEDVLLRVINSKGTDVSAQASIVKEGLSLFGLSVNEDTPDLQKIIKDRESISNFVYNLKALYNFVIIDCPMQYMNTDLGELAIISDTVAITSNVSNKSMLEFIMEITNINDHRVGRDIVGRGRVVLNRCDSTSGALLGYRYNNYPDIFAILDRFVYDSTGYSTDGMFSGMLHSTTIPTINGLDSLILGKKYFSETPSGKELYVNLLHSLLKKEER